MAIQSNVSIAPIALAAVNTDTTLVAAVTTPSRNAVTAFSLFNTQASARVVDIYESPNTTSASGTKIATYTIDALSSVDVVEIIGQGLSTGQNIIGRQTTSASASGDVNCKRTLTQYTAGS